MKFPFELDASKLTGTIVKGFKDSEGKIEGSAKKFGKAFSKEIEKAKTEKAKVSAEKAEGKGRATMFGGGKGEALVKLGLMVKSLDWINKGINKIAHYSPIMSATMDMFRKSFEYIVRPIADIFGTLLRPLALMLMRWAIKFYKTFLEKRAEGKGPVQAGLETLLEEPMIPITIATVMWAPGILLGAGKAMITGMAAAAGLTSVGGALAVKVGVFLGLIGWGTVAAVVGGLIGTAIGNATEKYVPESLKKAISMGMAGIGRMMRDTLGFTEEAFLVGGFVKAANFWDEQEARIGKLKELTTAGFIEEGALEATMAPESMQGTVIAAQEYNEAIEKAIGHVDSLKLGLDNEVAKRKELSAIIDTTRTNLEESSEVWAGLGTSITTEVKTGFEKIKAEVSKILSDSVSIDEKWASIVSWMNVERTPTGIIGKVASYFLPGRQSGGDVPTTGPYMLHAGERVVPRHEVGRGDTNYSPTININATVSSDIDIRRLAEEIAEYGQSAFRRRSSY